MAAKSFLRRVAGRAKEVLGVVISSGAANDGDIPALGSDGKLDASLMPSGFGQNTFTFTASEALAANDIVNIWNDGGAEKVRKADSSAEGKEAHGFVKAAVSSGASATVYLPGNVITGLTARTPGARQYLDHATPGGLRETPYVTTTDTGKVSQLVGIAANATSVIFEPEEPITVA